MLDVKHKNTLLFSALIFWSLYTLCYAYYKAIDAAFLSGYMAFFGETLGDVLLIILSYCSWKNSNNTLRTFFLLILFSFIAAFFSDFFYNYFLNIKQYQITNLRDSLFDAPFILFLLFQLLAWIWLFLKSTNNNRCSLTRYLPYMLASIIIFIGFIFCAHWKMQYTSVIGIYQIIDTALEAFEELLTIHRLKVPQSLRKTLMTTNPIESMFSLVRVCQKNVKRPRDSKMLQRWLASALLYCEKQFNRLTGYKDIDQVIKNIDLEFAAETEIFEKAA